MQYFRTLCLVSMFLVSFGCGNTCLAAANPVLSEVRISVPGSNAQHVEIIADSPLTYTYYRMPDLLKVVIDLALTDPGQIDPVITGSGLISKISVERKEAANTFSLTRIVIDLVTDADYAVHADAGSRSRLLVTLKPKKASAAVTGIREDGEKPPASLPEAAEKPAAALTTAPVAVSAPAPIAQPAAAAIPVSASGTAVVLSPPAQPASPVSSRPILVPVVPRPDPSRTINGIRISRNALEITANSRLDDYKAFTLIDPPRLVIDVPMSKAPLAAREIPLKRFGLSKARIGNYPDKVRVVFDADGDTFPAYRIDRNGKGLSIVFPEKKVK
ncbi:AMIN domain-containing protein [Geotalea sp. SG265]|uniref:AMIN domain-containing protein n=1 Tax=Geotalea sp. SG265 TaxID=2922867 RepID=UPI001FAF5DCA|nr:AMIN domain-containing protein [Geotalea sp. SG265]